MELQGVLAGRRHDRVGRQDHRQVLVGHGHDAARVAVDHRDRRAPVALAADQPVADAVVDRSLTDAAPGQPGRHLRLGYVAGRAGEGAGVDHRAVVVMVQHVAVELNVPPHLHRRAELLRVLVAGMAARHDRRVGRGRGQRQPGVVEHHLPAAAHDVGPVAGIQVLLQQVGIHRHLAVTRQRHRVEAAALRDGQILPRQAGARQLAAEVAGHRAVPDDALGDLIVALRSPG